MRQLKLHVPLSILTVKATTIAKEIDISSDDFVASPGWMLKFRQRYNVKSITLYGEPADVDQTDPELLVKLDALADVVVGYNNSYVFNMDETELFFRVLPRYSLLALGEDMASKAFEEVDVRVAFLPPNCTAWRQPCDLGIIAAMKKRYKFLMLPDVLSFYELYNVVKDSVERAAKKKRPGSAGVKYGRPAHVLDAASNIRAAWENESSSTIKNAFAKADIGVNFSSNIVSSDDNVDDEVVELDVLAQSFFAL
ncbi:hypothetical protein DYB37_009540 [Aphanomyces astaci]|uniref:HTH CENPB-type domain-containing protein n=1 Tax=Aphanomyces astaci TaxID=112090 RepID=A0A418ETI4_APHAT|nr:hypothetical protein DYB37_009540 [Aphanomyces astaci]